KPGATDAVSVAGGKRRSGKQGSWRACSLLRNGRRAAAADVEASTSQFRRWGRHAHRAAKIYCRIPHVFANAVQDRYDLNTTTMSASVGLSMLGSVSLPIGTSGANQVRVASNTV